uniref:Uncharacterized protein n=1 Tax=Cacopsylla melanoneura TaxID=428564 RepID=A0A8D9FD49_9HEMI
MTDIILLEKDIRRMMTNITHLEEIDLRKIRTNQKERTRETTRMIEKLIDENLEVMKGNADKVVKVNVDLNTVAEGAKNNIIPVRIEVDLDHLVCQDPKNTNPNRRSLINMLNVKVTNQNLTQRTPILLQTLMSIFS